MDCSEHLHPSARLLAILERLISIDTTSRKPNLEAVNFITQLLRERGIDTTVIPSLDGQKANVLAIVGPNAPEGVVLSGHLDVVPVEEQKWTVNPWRLTRINERLFGRGTADMKGFLAATLSVLVDANLRRLKRPLYLAFSYDEEVGGLGVPGLIAALRNAPSIAAVVVGEPTGMAVVGAHKATYGARTVVRGLEGHSSLPDQGLNACVFGARVVTYLGDLASELSLRRLPGSPFDPPHSTINVGIVRGGTARNIIPNECIVEWDCRLMPDEDPEEVLTRVTRFCRSELLPEMRESFGEAAIETEQLSFMPGLSVSENRSAETLVKRLLGTNATEAVAYATEAGFFQEAGLPTIVCGPGKIEQAHKPDEFVEVSQLAACESMILGLVEELSQ